MTPSVKHSPNKNKDLTFIPRALVKSWALEACSCNLRDSEIGGGNRQILGSLQFKSFSLLGEVPMGDLVLSKGGRYLGLSSELHMYVQA